MKPQKQWFRHEPDKNIYGDCFRTCIAILLDRDAHEIPHFMHGCTTDEEGNAAYAAAQEWLLKSGYRLVVTPFLGELALKEVLDFQKTMNPDVYYQLTGQSKNEVNHAVICCNDEIVCDPSLDNSGIIGPVQTEEGPFWYIEWLISANQVKQNG